MSATHAPRHGHRLRHGARRPRPRGVTLVELVVVMTIVALVASISATLVARVAASQQDNRERLALALAADVQLATLADQLHLALPNSVRLTSNAAGVWIEWVPVTDGGRFRAAVDATDPASPGDPLDLTDATDAAFDVIGTALATPAAGAQLVLQNLGTPEADAYAGTSRRGGLVLTQGNRRVNFTAAGALPASTDTRRFFIVGTPVTVACEALPGGGYELARYRGYGWIATQPAAAADLASGTRELLLTGLTACAASHSLALANIGALTLRLTLGSTTAPAAAAMTLLQQVALDNTP